MHDHHIPSTPQERCKHAANTYNSYKMATGSSSPISQDSDAIRQVVKIS